MVIKEGSNGKRHYSTCMLNDMPQSSLVFAVYFTPETPNFGTFDEVAHPTLRNLFYFIIFLLFNYVYEHI